MEARRRVKLSLTNRSIGLISPSWTRPAQRQARMDYKSPGPQTSIRQTHHILEHPRHDGRPTARRAVGRPGGHSEGPAPDPIPNSAVKTLRANGTAS